jgi:hypothetical protein
MLSGAGMPSPLGASVLLHARWSPQRLSLVLVVHRYAPSYPLAFQNL